MAKLSEQFAQQEVDQQQGVKTRKQRVAETQALKRQALEKQRFEALRSQAQQIQEERFKDKIVQETYTEEVPDWSKIPARFQRRWDGYNGNVKANLMKVWRSEGKTQVVTKTRDKVIPFTLEDVEGTEDNSYKDIFDTLSPELRQFFDTPDVVLENKAKRIETTKKTIQEKRAEADQRLADLRIKYEKKQISNREWYRDKQKRYSGDRLKSYKEKYRERDWKIENDYDEDVAQIQGYKKGLNKGLGELGSNKDVAFQDIESYAKDIGYYEKSKEEARNQNQTLERNQELEIRELQDAGYTANVITQSFKGNPQSVKLSFYNQKTGDWKQVAEVKTAGKIDVSGMTKLGFSEKQDRTFAFGGKEFKFKSSIPIYKDKSGMVVTPYASTGFTEAQLIKQAQDRAYDEYSTERKTKPINLPFVVVQKENLPIGYGSEDRTIQTDGMGNTVTPSVIMSEADYYRDPQQTSLSKLYGKIPEGTFMWNAFGLPADKGINVTKAIGVARDWLGAKSDAVSLKLSKEDKVAPLLDDLNQKYTDENQLRYEDLVAKDLIYGELTPEQAEKKYLESESYSILTKKYGEEYGKTLNYAISRENLGALDFAVATGKYGSKKFAYGLGDFALSRIETPKKLTETGAVVGGAVVTYGAVTGISPAVASAVNWGVIGAGAGYGAYETFKPSATPTSAFGGAVLLGTSLAFAGYGAYKYLRSPVVQRVAIKPPKMNLKSTGTIGKDVKVIQDGVTKANKVVYESQKLSQTGMAGSRATVTTKWRNALNQFNKKFNYRIKIDKIGGSGLGSRVRFDLLKPSTKPAFANIYEGVPTSQLGRSYNLGKIMRTKVKIFTPNDLFKYTKGLMGKKVTIITPNDLFKYTKDLMGKKVTIKTPMDAYRFASPRVKDLLSTKVTIKTPMDAYRFSTPKIKNLLSTKVTIKTPMDAYRFASPRVKDLLSTKVTIKTPMDAYRFSTPKIKNLLSTKVTIKTPMDAYRFASPRVKDLLSTKVTIKTPMDAYRFSKDLLSTKYASTKGFLSTKVTIKTPNDLLKYTKNVMGKKVTIKTPMDAYRFSKDLMGRKVMVKTPNDLFKYTKDLMGKKVTIKTPMDLTYKTKSAYQKSTDLLKRYGWSDAQAKATLRYTAPRVYETYLNKGVITVKGTQATGNFEYLIKRPVIEVDKTLGIKTRGGSTFKEITNVERQLIKDPITKKIYSQYSNIKGSGFVDKAGKFKDWKEVEWTTGRTLAKSTKGKGFEYLGKNGNLDIYKTDALYKDITSVSRDNAFKIKVTKTRGAYPYEIDVNWDPTKIKTSIQKTRLYDRIIDLDKGKNVFVKDPNFKKTPWSKTFGSDPAFTVKAEKGVVIKAEKSSKIVQDIVSKIDKSDDLANLGSKAGSQQSAYYGKGGGFIEESYGGGNQLQNKILKMDQGFRVDQLAPQEIIKNQPLLRLDVLPPQVKINQIKEMLLYKDVSLINQMQIGSLVGLKANQLIKQDILIKQDLKINQNLDYLVKEDLMYNVKQPVALKTSPILKQQLKTILDLSPTITPIANVPTYRPPKIPTFELPLPKPIVIPPFLKAQISKRSQRNGEKGFKEEAYLPDFTSRALGLGAESLTEKQAQKKLKKLMTGLEIRRSVKVKW